MLYEVITDDAQRQEPCVHIHMPRPVHVVENALGNMGVAEGVHDDAGPKLRMVAAVGDGVGFGYVVQQGTA